MAIVKPANQEPAGRGRVEAVATEIALGAEPPRGLLRRRQKRRDDAGSLLVTKQALVLEARHVLRGRLEIGWDSIRKAIVDDGARWGHVAKACRFPVYDLREDGSGSGTLIGPLWSLGGSLMPAACPLLEIDPVPAVAPNLALLFDPLLDVPSLRDGGGGAAALLLLHVTEPEPARAALAEQAPIGELDQGDFAYLEAAGSAGAQPRRAADSA
jgi:hypothetical protein